MKKLMVILLLCLSVPSVFAADASVGALSSFSGKVTLDAFGKGVFIPAVKGDALYASSVLRVGPGARATVDLKGQVRELPPGADVRVSDLLSAAARKSGMGWFSSVGKLLRSFAEASQHGEENLVLGSRAAEVPSENEGMEWEVEETDAAVLIPEARELIDQGRYTAALDTLAEAAEPVESSVASDLSFWKGFCYFQLEDYGNAARALSAAGAASAENQATLLFELGSSYYLLGQEKNAVAPLDAYLAGSLDGKYAPYAALFLAKSLGATGNPARAKSVAQAAAQKYKGSPVDAELAAFLK